MVKKLYYKIGEACKRLDIQPYVLRYWETEFPLLAPNKSTSGQRVYSEQDLQVIQRIKELLYEEGYTIAGAKKKLEKADFSSLGELKEPSEAAAGAAEEPVEEGDGDEKAAAAAPEVVKVAASKKKASVKKAAKRRAKASPSASEARLRRGIREALKESRAILEILDSD